MNCPPWSRKNHKVFFFKVKCVLLKFINIHRHGDNKDWNRFSVVFSLPTGRINGGGVLSVKTSQNGE